MKNAFWFKISYVIVSLVLTSCLRNSSNYQNYFILYNLSEPQKLEINVPQNYLYSGFIKTQLEDGTNVEGNFVFNRETTRENSNYGIRPGLSSEGESFFSTGVGKNKATGNKKVDIDLAKKNFPELFGYSSNIRVNPIGNATLMVGKSKVIEIVFYSMNRIDDSGSGVGKDNEGNLYRVYIITKTNFIH